MFTRTLTLNYKSERQRYGSARQNNLTHLYHLLPVVVFKRDGYSLETSFEAKAFQTALYASATAWQFQTAQK